MEPVVHALVPQKFTDPDWTAKGEKRAIVGLDRLMTLWINTGTLCNITCRNCYIESSPSNDRLAYMTLAETVAFLDEARELGTREIGFTGGEPFMNPDFLGMLEAALKRGFDVLVLTNAMQPMQRPGIKKGLIPLKALYGNKLTIRVSLDHFAQALHEIERGPDTFEKTLEGLDWLAANAFKIAIAGRTCWNETEDAARAGYGRLIAERGWPIDPGDHKQLMLLPEMDAGYDGPEISTGCWSILKISPSAMMCATSRMVVKRKGASSPVVLPCTLLPYDPAFEMGSTLESASRAHGPMFDRGAVKRLHFCVFKIQRYF